MNYVPLCAIHHHNIRTTGKEREWWRNGTSIHLKSLMLCGRRAASDITQRARTFRKSREESADARPKGGQASNYDSKRGVTASADDALDGVGIHAGAREWDSILL
jgi:hypothetical protein